MPEIPAPTTRTSRCSTSAPPALIRIRPFASCLTPTDPHDEREHDARDRRGVAVLVDPGGALAGRRASRPDAMNCLARIAAMRSDAVSVPDYIEAVADDRRASLRQMRADCLELLTGFEESMTYGMPCYRRDR